MFIIIACCTVDVVLLWVSTRIRVNSASHFISCSHFHSQLPHQKRGLRLRPNVLSNYLRQKKEKKKKLRENVCDSVNQGLYFCITRAPLGIFTKWLYYPPSLKSLFCASMLLGLWPYILYASCIIFLRSISICALMLLGLWPYILYASCMW